MSQEIVTVTDVSISNLIMSSDLMIKFIMIALLLASIWSWTIIFDKMRKLRSLKAKTAKFEREFDSDEPLEVLYERIKFKATCPLTIVFSAVMNEWVNNDIDNIRKKENLKVSLKDRLMQVMYISLARSTSGLKNGMNFLAISASTAPFIGLFGTVWGILSSFQSIAMLKNVSLAVVAPGISGALITTVMGLFVAIPAVIFYNIYTHRINEINEKTENFMSEVIVNLSRELDK